MPKNEQILFTRTDLLQAIMLLTRIPVPPGLIGRGPSDTNRDISASAWAWPLVGAGLGFIAGIIGLIVAGFGAGPGLSAGLTLAAYMMMTGALHEDGLADTFDGLWGGQTKTRRLEIMKDSHVGTYGVLALCLSVLLRWSALVVLIQSGWFLAALMAAAALSRAPMAVLIATMPNARGEGLAQTTGRPEQRTIFAMLAISVALGLMLIGWNIIEILFWITIVSIALASAAKNKISGQTGDILGASQQLAEITALAVLAATLG